MSGGRQVGRDSKLQRWKVSNSDWRFCGCRVPGHEEHGYKRLVHSDEWDWNVSFNVLRVKKGLCESPWQELFAGLLHRTNRDMWLSSSSPLFRPRPPPTIFLPLNISASDTVHTRNRHNQNHHHPVL
jgi:hypothetical protein